MNINTMEEVHPHFVSHPPLETSNDDDCRVSEEPKEQSLSLSSSQIVADTAPSNNDNQNSPPRPPTTSTQEEEDDDERIVRSLQQSGALSHVVGPTSLLSQELLLQEHMASAATGVGVVVHGSSISSNDAVTTTNNNSNLLDNGVDMTQQDNISSSQQSVNNMDMSSDVNVGVNAAAAISSSQLSNLVRAAEELDSPLVPNKQKTKTTTTTTTTSASSSTTAVSQPLFDDSKYEADYPSTTTNNNTKTTTRSVSSLPCNSDNTIVQQPNNNAVSTSIKNGNSSNKPQSSNNNSKSSNSNTRSRGDKEREASNARQLAQQAAELAARAIVDPEISKQMLLSMVLVRTNPRSPPTKWPPRGTVIDEGFFWGTYPPLETKLKSYMRAYYDLSITKCQSKEQQAFNNDMVVMIRKEAQTYGWSFSSNFSEKSLRDRVRCYFKTHIQNAKKRLKTMLMNPTKKANTKALIGHLDLIKAYADHRKQEEEQNYAMRVSTMAVAAAANRHMEQEQQPQQDCEGDGRIVAMDDGASAGPEGMNLMVVDDGGTTVAQHQHEHHVDVQNVMALGFANLSQDSYSNSTTTVAL